MDYVFNKLTDLGLRRLYKFVLKRTIGKYLEDELLIEQLEVRSRDGVVKLTDIVLNAQLLNEEIFDLLPVKVVSINVTELEVHLSYRTLLTDSCKFVVDQLNIVLTPNELYNKSKVEKKTTKTENEEEEVEDIPVNNNIPTETSTEGQKGLNFIANWIEVIVARLQVHVKSINITFQLPNTTSTTSHKTNIHSQRKKPSAEPTAPTHNLQLQISNLHYFNDDPKGYSGLDASAVALSTRLTTEGAADASTTARRLGSRKVVTLEFIAIQLVAATPTSNQRSSEHSTRHSSEASAEHSSEGSIPLLPNYPLIKLGYNITATVNLNKSQRNELKNMDFELTVPQLLLSIDIQSIQCLCTFITLYLSITTIKSNTTQSYNNATISEKNTSNIMSKSIIQNVLMSDPTLRTLFWLEEEEKRKKQQQKKLPSAAGRIEEKYKNMNRNTSTTTGGTNGSTGTGGEVGDDQIDFARVAQLMRQYRTTRNAITGETETSSYSHSSSTLPSTSPSLLMQSSRIVDSDSDGDFPDSPVSGEGYSDQEEDDDSVDSTEFYDTVARKPILKVRMGESKRLNSSITGSTTASTVLRSSALKSSTYGGSSKMMAESGLFHSTTSGLLRTSTATATGANIATSQVYASGYTGSVYATATPPLALSARLHIQAVDVVFTHLTANSAISALMNTTTTNSSSNTTTPTTTPVDLLRLGRDELCIHMEETVLTMSTIYTPPTSTLQHPYSNPSHTEAARNTISVNISTNEVQLFEQYKDKSYHILCNTIKQKYPTSILPLQRQVFISLHSIKDSRRIYASPHINASIEYTPSSSSSKEKSISPTDLNKQSNNCANIKATITIEPIIASFSIVSIEYWVVELSKIPSIAVADEESSTNITCSVNLSQVEVFLHSDSCVENYATIAQHIQTTTANTNTTSSGSTSSSSEEDRPQNEYTVYWDTVLDALDLTTYPGSWIPLQNHSPSAPYYHHLTDTRGGFRFLLHNICIKLTSSARIRNRLLNESANLSNSSNNSTGSSSAEKRCKSNESMLHSIEMTKVALYVYVSLPQTATNSNSSSNMNDSSDRLFEKERRHFYNTLMVQATSDETGKYKVILGRTNPHSESSIMRLCSEESQDSDYVLLRDAYKTASNLPTNTSPLGSGDTRNTSTGGSSRPSRAVPASAAQSGGDQGPPAPEVSPGNLVYISAYHIQVDIKQREYNALMMVADTISPKPSGGSDPTAATVPVRSDKPTTTNTTAASSKVSNQENINSNMKSSTTSSTSTTTSNTSTGFGFILSSNIATICLSDNPPHQFSFPELDQLIAEAKKTNANQYNHTSSTNNTSKTHINDTKSYSLCVSIIEPSIEVLISKKDIYLSIKADDLSVYEMELAQFHDLVHSGFDFNQTTGREARYGSSKHLIPFIRRASLHALDVGGTEKKETFSTLLGDNQDYGRAFEVRLLLSSTTATSSSTSTTTTTSTGNNPVISTTEMKSVHFFIDFYDIMLSYDPQSTWILSIANMLTPQTPAQILCHRQVQRLAAVEQRYHQLTAEQQIALGCTLDEIIQNFTGETSSNRQLMETQNRQQPMKSSIHSNNSSSSHTENNKKPIITLNLPFELTKINVRVRNCIIDYCCYPVNSRTFLTIGLLTVTSTIASNSQRFSLKFKVGGLSLYISNTLPLLTDNTTNGTSTATTTTRSRYRKKPSHNQIPRAELFPTTATNGTTSSTVPMPVPVEIYEEDINHFFHTHCFIALASVDHIDVLVTINNSVQEALVIQITIGQCSIHACVDSLDLFAKTMKEWFEEFQIACEKSEAVMQKQKASSKPGRDLAVSQYAFQAPTNNLLDDDTFDTIRFCDTIPTAVEEGGGDGSSSNAHIASTTATSTSTTAAANVVPRVVIEDMSMADLIARTEREGRHVRSGKEINYHQQQAHSATMLASDMNALLVEDYYQGLSLSTEPTQTTSIQKKQPYIEGKTDQFPHREPDRKASFTNTVAKESEDYYLEHNTENISKASVKSVQEVPILHKDSSSGKKKSSTAHLEPHFIPQYDYEMDYDFDGTDGTAASTETLAVEPEGVGGFYADGAVEDLGEMEAESVYDEGEYQDSDDASQEDNKLQDGEGEGLEAAEIRSSTESVQSIELDDDEDDSPDPLSESNISQSYSTKEENAAAEQLSQSVFGLGNFSYWAATAAASNKPLEEFELKDFNPANIELRSTLSPVVSTANLPFAYNPNTGTTAAGTVIGTGANAPPLYVQVGKNNTTEDTEPGWLQDELSASIHTDGSPRMAQIVSATSHNQNRDFADNSDPEDEIGEDIWKAVPSEPHTTECPPDEEGETEVGKEGEKEVPLELTEVSYEADFGLEEEVNFLPDFGEDDSAQQQEAVPTTIATGSSGKSTSSDPAAAVSAEESGQAGWKKFPEGMASGSYSPTSSLSPRQPQEDTAAAIAAHSVEQPVITASAPTAAVAVLGNLDRAWQQQPGDYIYDPNQAAAAVAAANTTTILQQQQQQMPITHAQVDDVSYKLAQLGLNPTDKASINAVPAPVVGLRKASAGQSMQRMEVAQWYENPEVLEILPHYIPVVSRSEDLDDNRPAEEQSLPTKMLMKLKGTFKIRLFQGNDWRTSPQQQQAGGYKAKDADVDTMKKATGSGDSNMQQQGVSSTTTAVTDKGDGTGGIGGGKSVRFCKEDLLRDLTTPPPATTAAAAATAKPSSSAHRPATSTSTSSGRSSGGSRGSSKPSPHPTTATSRPPRSQRPLFEETYSTGNKTAEHSGDTDTKKSDQQRKSKEREEKQLLLPRQEREMLDTTFKDLFFCIRIYENSSSNSHNMPVIYSLPSQRIVCSALDFLVSFGHVGMRRKKVLGSWTSLKRPRDTLEPVLRCAFLAYENPPLSTSNSNSTTAATAAVEPDLEHRLYVRILPLRCYLDEQIILFAKSLAATSTTTSTTTSTASNTTTDTTTAVAVAPSKEPYFQSIMISAVELKIDYRASTVNIAALHQGDYLQMLNIFPLDGLEITLKHVKLNGIQGIPTFLHQLGEFWVKDIYANQLHRVISGTAPFRGLSNIGHDLHELLAIPLSDYRKTGGTMKHLRRSTRTLVRTVTRETLHATQQLTMFVANAITELASDSPVTKSPVLSNKIEGRVGEDSGSSTVVRGASTSTQRRHHHSNSGGTSSGGDHQQPSGVVEGLQQAYGSVAREVGSAAETVIAIPIREYVHTGPGGYLKSVIRALPIAVLRPVAGVMEGISYTMLGLRNDLDPGARLDEEDIWNVDIGTAAFPGSPVRISNANYQMNTNTTTTTAGSTTTGTGNRTTTSSSSSSTSKSNTAGRNSSNYK